MGEKPTEAMDQAASSTATGGTSSTSGPAAAAPVADAGRDISAELNINVQPPAAQEPMKFTYMCLHCGAPREVSSGRYTGECAACGQTGKSGNDQMDAVSRGEHVATFDRSSPFFP